MSDEPYATIATLVANNWSHCPIRDFDSSFAVPSDRSAFAELTYPVRADEEMISIGDPGNNVFRMSQAFMFCVYAPMNDTKSTWRSRLNTFRSVFRGYSGLSGHLRMIEAPGIAFHASTDYPGYFAMSIAVPFTYDIFD